MGMTATPKADRDAGAKDSPISSTLHDMQQPVNKLKRQDKIEDHLVTVSEEQKKHILEEARLKEEEHKLLLIIIVHTTFLQILSVANGLSLNKKAFFLFFLLDPISDGR